MSGRATPRTGPPAAWTWRILSILLIPLCLGLRVLIPDSSALVEHAYSRTVYPVLVAALAALTDRVPFSLA